MRKIRIGRVVGGSVEAKSAVGFSLFAEHQHGVEFMHTTHLCREVAFFYGNTYEAQTRQRRRETVLFNSPPDSSMPIFNPIKTHQPLRIARIGNHAHQTSCPLAIAPIGHHIHRSLAMVSKPLRAYKAGPDHRFCTSFPLYTTHFEYKSFLAGIFGFQISWDFE